MLKGKQTHCWFPPKVWNFNISLNSHCERPQATLRWSWGQWRQLVVRWRISWTAFCLPGSFTRTAQTWSSLSANSRPADLNWGHSGTAWRRNYCLGRLGRRESAGWGGSCTRSASRKSSGSSPSSALSEVSCSSGSGTSTGSLYTPAWWVLVWWYLLDIFIVRPTDFVWEQHGKWLQEIWEIWGREDGTIGKN